MYGHSWTTVDPLLSYFIYNCTVVSYVRGGRGLTNTETGIMKSRKSRNTLVQRLHGGCVAVHSCLFALANDYSVYVVPIPVFCLTCGLGSGFFLPCNLGSATA
jgi:hypothetical protein